MERVLLGRNEKCIVKGHIMKIIDDDSLRVSYPWGSVSFNWLVQSIRGCVKTFKSMSSTRYMISGFPYALNVWLLEVFPIFRGFSSFHGLKSPRMLSWGPTKQVDHKVITDNFFHAEKIFKKFIVHAVVVCTEQEMLDYPVALKFPDDSGSCSSSAVLPSQLSSQIVDGVLSSVKKQLDDERFTIVNQVKSLYSRFEELDKKFVGAINVVDSLVPVHDETKSCVAVSESAKRTCLESRLDSLESKFDYVMHCIESLVRLHSENKSCKSCASGKRQHDLGYSVNDEVKLDAHLGKDLQERMENMLCKARFTKNVTSPMLDMLCDAAISSSSQLSDKTQTQTHSQFEKEFVKENEDRAKKEALKEVAAINDGFQCGDYVSSSNEASQNVNEVAVVEDCRKRLRCEDGNKEDDG